MSGLVPTVSTSDEMDMALNNYVNMIIRLCANFMTGLLINRSLNLKHTIHRASCSNIRGGVVSEPMLNQEMVQYILTQILPLSQVLEIDRMSSEYSKIINDRQLKDNIHKKFNETLLSQSKVAKLLQKCWPINQAQPTSFIDEYAVNMIVKAKEKLRSFLEGDSSLQTYDDYLNALKSLRVYNELYLSNIDFETKQFRKLTKCVIWMLSAINDWYGVEIVEPADIESMMLLMMVFEPQDKVIQLYNTKVPTLDRELLKPLYNILQLNGMYVSESALLDLVNFYQTLYMNPKMLDNVLNFGLYYYNL